MNLRSVDSLEISGKKVLIRADLDVDVNEDPNLGTKNEHLRLLVLKPLVEKILTHQAERIILLGHRGRPKGEDQNLSLLLLKPQLEKVLEREIIFVNSWDFEVISKLLADNSDKKLFLFENLRFHPGEEENSEGFAQYIASFADVFVNEAFAVSHRKHASIVGIEKVIPHAFGDRFIAEIDNLSKVFSTRNRPVISVISGLKEDKLSYVTGFSKFSDRILLAGRLPEYIEKMGERRWQIFDTDKVMIADLIPDKEDITVSSIERFEKEIDKASMIILSGPIGKYEDEGHRQGTERIFSRIAESSAFKIAGGGDTEKAMRVFNLEDKFDWVSIGGGAMLEYLSNKTLPVLG